MSQQEVAHICDLFRVEFTSVMQLLMTPTLEPGQLAAIRAHYALVATYLERLAELVGACEAYRIMLFVYTRVFEEERQRRGERCP